jgi:hypothetical protein
LLFFQFEQFFLQLIGRQSPRVSGFHYRRSLCQTEVGA